MTSFPPSSQESGELKQLFEQKVGPSYRRVASTAAPASAGAPQQEDLDGRIKRLLASEPVLLFMKGTPDAPRCGFSRKVGMGAPS